MLRLLISGLAAAAAGGNFRSSRLSTSGLRPEVHLLDPEDGAHVRNPRLVALPGHVLGNLVGDLGENILK